MMSLPGQGSAGVHFTISPLDPLHLRVPVKHSFFFLVPAEMPHVLEQALYLQIPDKKLIK